MPDENSQSTEQQQTQQSQIYTRDDLDSAVAAVRRAERERYEKLIYEKGKSVAESTIEEWRAQHGITDDMLSAIEKKKVKAPADPKDDRIKELESQLRNAELSRKKDALRSKIYEAATKSNSNDPETVWLHIERKIRASDGGDLFTVDREGNEIEIHVANMVKELLDERPHLISIPQSAGAGSRAGGGSTGAKKDSLMTREGREQFLRNGGFER